MTTPARRLPSFTLFELIVVLAVLGVLAALAVPTYDAVKSEALDRRTQVTAASLLREAGALASLRGGTTFEGQDLADASGDLVGASSRGAVAAGWTLKTDPGEHSSTYGEIHAGLSVGQETAGAALRTPTGRCALARAGTTGVVQNWLSDGDIGAGCRYQTALAGPAGPAGPIDGFALAATGGDAEIDLEWPSQPGVSEYRVECNTAAIDPAGDTPKVVAGDGDGTENATVGGVENFVEHTCVVVALYSPTDVASSPAVATPYAGPPGDDDAPGPGPPEGPGDDPPPGPTPPGADECLASPGAECLTSATTLAGLASFTSAHAGTHQVYVVDTSASKIRVVVDSGARAAATKTISVIDASGSPVSLAGVTDLVAGKHPSRIHPFGPSPFSVMYASTSSGDIWLISPISGSATWRGYPVASGLGPVSALAFDHCPASEGSSSRAVGTSCVFAATAAGVRVVPMTDASAPTLEAAWAPSGAAGAAGLASNTADGLGGSGDGALFSTGGSSLVRHDWSGATNTLSNSGTAMTASAGVSWMADNFYVTDTSARRVFRVTPSGVRSVVAGSGADHVGDGTGTAATFSSPTRIHWHGSTPNLYVLDANCVRRLNASTGEVTTLACPATRTSSALMRVDSPQGGEVYSPSSVSVLANSSTASGVIAGLFSLTVEFAPQSDWVVFDTVRGDLGPTDTNATYDVYRKNLATGEVQRITDGSTGAPTSGFQPRVSNDGNTIAYLSTNSRILYVTTISGGVPSTVSAFSASFSFEAAVMGDVAGDASMVSFTTQKAIGAADTNNADDVFVYDVDAATTTRVSTTAAGGQSGPSSTDCGTSQFSPDGTRILFACALSGLVAGDTNGRWDVFVKTLSSGAISRVSVGADNTTQGDQDSMLSQGSQLWSADGTKVLFSSSATNLVAGDTNAVGDMFIKDISNGSISRIVRADGTQLSTGSYVASYTPDGTRIAFATADNLGEPGSNTTSQDIFVMPAGGGGTYWLASATGSGTGGGWVTGGASQYNIALSNTKVAYHLRYVNDGNNRFLAVRDLP